MGLFDAVSQSELTTILQMQNEKKQKTRANKKSTKNVLYETVTVLSVLTLIFINLNMLRTK